MHILCIRWESIFQIIPNEYINKRPFIFVSFGDYSPPAETQTHFDHALTQPQCPVLPKLSVHPKPEKQIACDDILEQIAAPLPPTTCFISQVLRTNSLLNLIFFNFFMRYYFKHYY